jgi:hypothetical protein
VHAYNGRAPGFKIPGLTNCSPGAVGTVLFVSFASLPEADWQEGQHYTETEARDADAARHFASQYNRTVLQTYRVQLARACPNARLD